MKSKIFNLSLITLSGLSIVNNALADPPGNSPMTAIADGSTLTYVGGGQGLEIPARTSVIAIVNGRITPDVNSITHTDMERNGYCTLEIAPSDQERLVAGPIEIISTRMQIVDPYVDFYSLSSVSVLSLDGGVIKEILCSQVEDKWGLTERDATIDDFHKNIRGIFKLKYPSPEIVHGNGQ